MELLNYLKAGYALFAACNTYEMQRCVESMVTEIESFTREDGTQVYNPVVFDFEKNPDPEEALGNFDDAEPGTILIAKNFNWFLWDDLGKPEKNIVTFIQNRVDEWTSRGNRKAFVIVTDDTFNNAIPNILSKDFISLEFELPDMREIERIYDSVMKAAEKNPKFKRPVKEKERMILDNARGMTQRDVKNSFSLGLVKGEGEIEPKTIARMKAREVEKTAGLKIGEYDVDFSTLKGYDNVKEFVLGTIKHPNAKGVLLLGPPGTGKTHFCRCLGNETGMLVLEAEMAELFGGLVGESEALMKSFISIVSALAPCILFIDEIEKALAGVRGGQSGDGGTTKRSMAQLLKFMSDTRPKGVYIVATCNDISGLPPEWVRPGRWDSAPFFIDLPNHEELKMIYKYYLNIYNVDPGKLTVTGMEGWTGAEIETSCRIADMMNTTVKNAVKFIRPTSKTMETEITALRKWSKNRTIPASTKIYNGAGKKERSLEL